MPTQLPVSNVARVVVEGAANGITIANVFHVGKSTVTDVGFTDAQLLAIANGLGTAWDTYLAGKLHNGYTPGQTTATDLTNELGHAQSRTNTGSGISGGAVPSSAACVISWKIDRHYRGGHPRTYLGPLSSGALSGPTTLDASYVSSVVSAASSFRTAVLGITSAGEAFRLVCVHRYRFKDRLDPPQQDPITGLSVDSRIDSQRRRLGPDR